MKITKLKEVEICDFKGCGKDIDDDPFNFIDEKRYCWDHYKKLRLVNHEHRIKYRYYGFDYAHISKYCDWNSSICKLYEEKTLFNGGVDKDDIFKTIYENQDLLDLLVEKLKERK